MQRPWSLMRPGGTLLGVGSFVNGADGNLLLNNGEAISFVAAMGPFGAYGGPTPSCLITAVSVAANAGSAVGAPAVDQRGVARPAGSGVDVGAVEAGIALLAQPPTVPSFVPMTPYQLAATGAAPHSVAIRSGALPAGLSLSGAGELSGTPTASGSFSINLTITDATGLVGWEILSLTVAPRRLVTNTNDTGAGSLRDVVTTLAPLETIAFDPAYFATARAIALSSPITLPRSLTLTGPGKTLLTITGAATRLFAPGSHAVTLTDMTLQQFNDTTAPGGSIMNTTGDLTLLRCRVIGSNFSGSSLGGAFRVSGATASFQECEFTGLNGSRLGAALWAQNAAVTATDCVFSSISVGEKGGAIYHDVGPLSLTRCYFQSSLSAGAEGGAVWHRAGDLTITQCRFNGATTAAAGTGGAIYQENGPLSLTGSIFANGSTGTGGGGAARCVNAAATATDCYFHDLYAAGRGGVFRTDSSLTLLRSAVKLGTAEMGGGAIFATGGALSVTDGSFEQCRAISGTGAAIDASTAAVNLTRCAAHNNTAMSRNGAVALSGGSFVAERCSFTDNSGGALYHGGSGGSTAQLSHCALSGNAGAIEVSSVAVTLNHCTVTGNAGPFTGGIFGAEPMLTSCVFTGNSGPIAADAASAAAGSANNMMATSPSGLTHGVNGNQLNVTAMKLSPVADYGFKLPVPQTLPPLTTYIGPAVAFPLRYAAPLHGSPALSAAAAGGGADLLGTSRPQGPGPDAGAVEAGLRITSTLPNGQVNSVYGPHLPTVDSTLVGGAPYRFMLGSGALPAGLTLETSTGRIFGTPNSLAVGTHVFQVLVITSTGIAGGTEHSLTIAPAAGSTVVQNANDSGPGSLRQVLADSPAGSLVDFSPTFFATPRAITLASHLEITKNVTIIGPGAHLVTIDPATTGLAIRCTTAATALTLEGLKIQGRAPTAGAGGSALHVVSAGGALNLRRCWFQSATVWNGYSVYSDKVSQVTAQSCSFTGPARAGLSITGTDFLPVTALVENCSFSGADGGGTAPGLFAELDGGSLLTLRHNSFVGNKFGLRLNSVVDGLTATLANNVFAGSTAGIDFSLGSLLTMNSQGGNVIEWRPSPDFTIGTDIVTTDARMVAAGDFGGTMATCIPCSDSPAISAAQPTGGLAIDQIGQARPLGSGSDSGAREAAPLTISGLPVVLPSTEINKPLPAQTLAASGGSAPYVFTAISLPAGLSLSSGGVLSGSPTTLGANQIALVRATDSVGFSAYAMARLYVAPAAIVTNGNDSGAGSLRQVLADALNGAVVTFAPSVSVVTLNNFILFNGDITIDGGPGVIVRPAVGNTQDLLRVHPDTGVTARGLHFENCASTALTITAIIPATVENCSTTNCSNGVIANGPLTIRNCLIRGVTGSYGIRSSRALTATNCTVTGDMFSYGVGFSGHLAPVELIHCTASLSNGFCVGAAIENPSTVKNCLLLSPGRQAVSDAGLNAAQSVNNVVDAAGAGGLTHGVNGNRFRQANEAPLTAPLANYGGSQAILLPVNGGAALDASPTLPQSPTSDARGVARPQGAAADAGSAEANVFMGLKQPLPVVNRYDAFPATVIDAASFNYSGSGAQGTYTTTLLTTTLPPGMTWTAATNTLSGTPTASGTTWLLFTASSPTGQGAAVAVPLIVQRLTVVTTSADSGPGSLRDLMSEADGDALTFAPGITEVTLTGTDMVVTRPVTINGGEASGVTIRRTGGAGRAFTVTTSAGALTLRGLTFHSFNTGSSQGSVIRAELNTRLILDQCLIRNCAASAVVAAGVEIFVNNSIFTALPGGDTNAPLVFQRFNEAPVPVVQNCTFYGCSRAILDFGQGTILYNNVIAACSTTPMQNISGSTATSTLVSPMSRNNKIEGPVSIGLMPHGERGNYYVTAPNGLRILPLGNYGGTRPVCLPASNSIAVDGADPSVSTSQDLRGIARPQGNAPDAGAAESLFIIDGILPHGTVGSPYATTLFTATGGTAPYTWTATGLPTGLSLNAATGLVSGTPTAAVAAGLITITATDANGVIAVWMDAITITTAAARVPEIAVYGGGVEISHLRLEPTAANFTHLGEVPVTGGFVQQTYTVRNLGNGPLNISNMTITTEQAADFSIIKPPLGSLAGNASGSITIGFNPSALGFRQTLVNILSNDSDENIFTFSISGIGVEPALGVSGQGVTIANADATPSVADGTLLGAAAISGSSLTQQFSVSNTGTGSLLIDGVSFTGAAAGDYSATWPASVPQGQGGVVSVTFRPTVLGSRMATLSLASNAAGQSPFTFALTGTGVASPATVRGNGVIIADDDTTPSAADHTHFGSLPAGSVQTRTYTITNALATPLTLGTVTLSGPGANQFRLSTPPPASVPGNGTATLSIEYLRLSFGSATATVALTLNGDASDPYQFAIEGAGTGLAGGTPTNITLSAATLAENNAPGALVGLLTATDPDEGEPLSISLVSGTGSTDNAAFVIEDNELRLLGTANFEVKNSYAIRARATDAGGLFFEKNFTITITNVNDVPSFTAGTDRIHAVGATGAFTVANWATAIASGDAPAVQTLTFNATVVSGASIFSVAPAISSTGQLTYTLSGTVGQAIIDVTLTDDASIDGTARASAPQRFVISPQATPDFALTLNATTFSLVENTSAGDRLALFREGAWLRFVSESPTRTFSLNGGANQAGSISINVTTLPATLTTVSVNLGGGADTLDCSLDLDLPAGAQITFTAESINAFYGTRITTPGAGTIKFVADDIGIDPAALFAAGTSITAHPALITRAISLGGSSSGLSLDDSELNTLATPRIIIGQTGGSPITTVGHLQIAQADELRLVADAAQPLWFTGSSGGIDVSANFSGVGTLYTAVNSPTNYDTLTVAGTVTLTGMDVSLSAYTPVNGDVFVLIDNDGTDPVVGEFTGKPNNAFFSYNGRLMRIRYAGGDGNDVTLTAESAANDHPDITVAGNGVNILDNAGSPTTADFRDFGNQFVDSSIGRVFVIKNDGTVEMTLNGPSLTGPFTIDPLPAKLQPGQTTNAVIRFVPTATGVATGTVTINSNDPDETAFEINLRGNGVARPALALGDVVVTGFNGLNDTFTFVPLVDLQPGTLIHFTDYGWSSTNTWTNSAQDGRIRWDVTTLIRRGAHLRMTLAGNDGTPANNLTNLANGADLTSQIVVTGWTGTATPLGGTAGDGLFIHGAAITNPFFIYGFNNSGAAVGATGWNTVNAPIESTSRLPTGTNSQNSLASTALGLAGGASQQDNVRYNGSIALANRTSYLSSILSRSNWVGDNTGVAQGSIPTAITIGAGEITITPSATGSYGNLALSSGGITREYAIANSGTGYLLLGAATISGPAAADFTITTTPTRAVAVGEATTLTVTFSPTASGTRAATLTIPSNDSDEAATTIALNGTSIIDANYTSTSLTPDGRLSFTIPTQAGLNYQVQTSSTLAPDSWVTIHTLVGTGNPMTYIVPGSATRQFLRVLWP